MKRCGGPFPLIERSLPPAPCLRSRCMLHSSFDTLHDPLATWFGDSG